MPEGATDVKMVFTLNGVTTTVTEYTLDEKGRYCYEFSGLNPQKIGDSISATLYATLDGATHTNSVPDYSVRKYCINMLTNYPEETKLVRLVSALLVYGEKTQIYQKYKTDALVTDGLTLDPGTFAPLDESFNKQSKIGTVDPNVRYTGAALKLSNEMVVRFGIETDDPTPYTFEITINGRKTTYTADDLIRDDVDQRKYYIEFCGIKATEFDSVITAVIKKDGQQIGQAVTYSVCTYIQKQYANADNEFAELLAAIYNYGVSANNY